MVAGNFKNLSLNCTNHTRDIPAGQPDTKGACMSNSSAYVTCSVGGTTYTYHFTGVSLQKVPDRTYDRTGTNVTHTLLPAFPPNYNVVSA